jgi:hypothetical protein
MSWLEVSAVEDAVAVYRAVEQPVRRVALARILLMALPAKHVSLSCFQLTSLTFKGDASCATCNAASGGCSSCPAGNELVGGNRRRCRREVPCGEATCEACNAGYYSTDGMTCSMCSSMVLVFCAHLMSQGPAGCEGACEVTTGLCANCKANYGWLINDMRRSTSHGTCTACTGGQVAAVGQNVCGGMRFCFLLV